MAAFIKFAFPAIILFFQLQTAHSQTITQSVLDYSEHVHASYKETLDRAVLLQDALEHFIANPSVVTQEAAKAAWIHARESYGQTEVFRFYNGPIDRDGGPEGLLNSWPLDESYIDYVVGNPNAGIIGNITQYPMITKELLTTLNELDGEKNISTGYHAIEFLLWGQDFFKASAGQRSFEDYTTGLNAARRAQYLSAAAEILVEDLQGLESEWAQGGAFRQEFTSFKDTVALKKLLSGIIYLAGDELSGERMYVAYDSRGQEDEHSCFSDMTHMDVQWNYWGVENVLKATKLLELPELKGKKVVTTIQNRMVSLRALLASIPAPFDQAIASEPGRAIILNSVEELEALAKDLVEVSVLLNARVDY